MDTGALLYCSIKPMSIRNIRREMMQTKVWTESCSKLGTCFNSGINFHFSSSSHPGIQQHRATQSHSAIKEWNKKSCSSLIYIMHQSQRYFSLLLFACAPHPEKQNLHEADSLELDEATCFKSKKVVHCTRISLAIPIEQGQALVDLTQNQRCVICYGLL